ncbi:MULTISPECIES: metallophosphoesterase [unclassified Achromobacter]|uniref:metallophosphoesterase family protein n=1 Tax=unclassified Achromobacter TaxID=2626865 RepID=UPI000B51DD70|nr:MULTISPECIES: metallophosphoesterase [unclassified Achromobacter]OWT80184.1 DNA repair exonuclease [Achromobacter sp. HZ34]OWT82067.1 DNA repair exonuclease [Achromobacter sp. HZ28]
MTRVLHISDTHFGTEQAPVVQALLDLAPRLAPDLVVLSGDITQRARARQFAAARQFVADLGFPVLAIPGNHDIPLFNIAARMFNPYGGYKRAMGVTLEPVFSSDGLLVVGVNTTRPSRHKNGVVSRAQVERVGARLRQARPGQLRVVVVHQPLRAIVEEDVSNLLIGRQLAIPAWVEAGADLVLGGHIHLPYVVPLGETAGRQAWVVQAGTATSHRVRGGIPNSVNVIEHHAAPTAGDVASCVVERWDFDASLGAFAAVDRKTLLLARAG